MKKLLLPLLLVCFLTACGVNNTPNLKNETATSINSFIIDNKTTQQEVEAKFGKPKLVSTGYAAGSGRPIVEWYYEYSSGFGALKALSLTFNQAGRVLQHRYGGPE
jgi:hypothetical protein